MSGRRWPLIWRSCDLGVHCSWGIHAWWRVNPVTDAPYRRGHVTFLCPGRQPPPRPPVKPVPNVTHVRQEGQA